MKKRFYTPEESLPSSTLLSNYKKLFIIDI